MKHLKTQFIKRVLYWQHEMGIKKMPEHIKFFKADTGEIDIDSQLASEGEGVLWGFNHNFASYNPRTLKVRKLRKYALQFNEYLLHLDQALQDLVIVHELAHNFVVGHNEHHDKKIEQYIEDSMYLAEELRTYMDRAWEYAHPQPTGPIYQEELVL